MYSSLTAVDVVQLSRNRQCSAGPSCSPYRLLARQKQAHPGSAGQLALGGFGRNSEPVETLRPAGL